MAKKNEVMVDAKAFSLDHEKYNKVSCSAQLREIKLIASSYAVRPEAFELSQDLGNMKNSFSGKCTDFIYAADDGLAWGRFQ